MPLLPLVLILGTVWKLRTKRNPAICMKVKRANRNDCQGELSVDLHDTKGNVDHIQCNGDQSAYLCNELRIGLSTRYVKNTFLTFQDSLHCRFCVEGKHGTAVVVQ